MWRYNPLTGNLDKVGLINVAPLCTITSTAWDIPPDNINLAVDGNPDTATGIGQRTLSTAGTIGNVHLEPPKGIYLVGVKFSFWSDGSGKVLARIYSEDMSGTLHLTGIIADYMNKNSEFERNGLATIVTIDNTFKRVVLSFRGNEADTYYIKIYEIFLFKII